MMTPEEKMYLYDLAEKAENRGDFKEAERIYQSIPFEPSVAKILKEVHGADYLCNSGYNLSEAEEVYGKDWLNRNS